MNTSTGKRQLVRAPAKKPKGAAVKGYTDWTDDEGEESADEEDEEDVVNARVLKEMAEDYARQKAELKKNKSSNGDNDNDDDEDDDIYGGDKVGEECDDDNEDDFDGVDIVQL